jgi:hypothetical protein
VIPFIVGAGPPDLFVGTPLASVAGYPGVGSASAAGAVAIKAAHKPPTINADDHISAGYADVVAASRRENRLDHDATARPNCLICPTVQMM